MSRRERKDRAVYYYRLQVDAREEGAEPLWVDMSGGECSRMYGEGYIDAYLSFPGPRRAVRLVKVLEHDNEPGDPDVQVIAEARCLPGVSVGQIAGTPSASQLRDAAKRALDRAEAIEDAEARRVAARRVRAREER